MENGKKKKGFSIEGSGSTLGAFVLVGNSSNYGRAIRKTCGELFFVLNFDWTSGVWKHMLLSAWGFNKWNELPMKNQLRCSSPPPLEVLDHCYLHGRNGLPGRMISRACFADVFRERGLGFISVSSQAPGLPLAHPQGKRPPQYHLEFWVSELGNVGSQGVKRRTQQPMSWDGQLHGSRKIRRHCKSLVRSRFQHCS